jgi:TPR repeat protein
VSVSRCYALLLVFIIAACAQRGEEAYGRGMGAYGAKRYAEAATYLQQGAVAGHVLSMATLGGMYLKGTGVPANPVKAAGWLEKAASLGNREAQSIVGLLYFNGMGVKRDATQARFWLRKAAAQGDKQSSWVLENLIERGTIRL